MKWQTAGIKFTLRQKISIFVPQGRLIANLAEQNFAPIGARGWECGPK